MDLFHEVKHENGAAVIRVELVIDGHHPAHGLFQAFVRSGLIVEPDGVEVARILKVAHGAEGDVYQAVGIVIASLHFRAYNSDDFNAKAIDADSFAQRVTPGEELFLGLGAYHCDAGVLHLVFWVVEAALRQFECADGNDVRVVAGNVEVERPSLVLDVCLLGCFGGDPSDLRNIGGEHVHVVKGKAYGRTGLLAASLHGGTARNHYHQLGAEVGEDVGACPTEAVAVSKQQDDCGYAPSHAEHGESGAPTVVLHSAIGLSEQIPEHRLSPKFYSCRSASTGCSMAALRAGYSRRRPPPASSCQSREWRTRAPVWE